MADEQTSGVAGHESGAKAQPSGAKGDTPATAGKGETKVTSGAAEKSEGQLNPSSPGNTGTTPGTVPKLG
ncbi:MAG: hypothetical protein HIU91_07525 [Acidobacteria bacterium]|nr:hypothetical protein [Acidobacteriota bacterium]